MTWGPLLHYALENVKNQQTENLQLFLKTGNGPKKWENGPKKWENVPQKKTGNQLTNWEFKTFSENRKQTQKLRKRIKKIKKFTLQKALITSKNSFCVIYINRELKGVTGRWQCMVVELRMWRKNFRIHLRHIKRFYDVFTEFKCKVDFQNHKFGWLRFENQFFFNYWKKTTKNLH